MPGEGFGGPARSHRLRKALNLAQKPPSHKADEVFSLLGDFAALRETLNFARSAR
jgi:hypothetical protein